jgi:hypothetical protein
VEVANLLAFARTRYPEWLEKGYYDSIVKQWRTTFPGRIEPLAIEVLERAHREAKEKNDQHERGSGGPAKEHLQP